MARGRWWLAGSAGAASSPQLPMVLKVPRLNTSPLALCDRPFSLLGFGDILVPGTGAGHKSGCPTVLVLGQGASRWTWSQAGGDRMVLVGQVVGRAG